MPDLHAVFRREADEQLLGIQDALLRAAEGDHSRVQAAFRLVHTLKGNAAMLAIREVVQAAGELEEAIIAGDVDKMLDAASALATAMPMDDHRQAPAARVAQVVGLDELTNAANELTILRNRLLSGGDVQAIDGIVDRVYRGVMSMRLQRVAPVLDRVRISAMEAARKLGKRVRVEVESGNVSLERDHLGPLSEVLGHLARNAVDHGIEPEGARREAGKRPTATLRVACHLDGEDAIIEVRDDGGGLDTAKLAALAPGTRPDEAIFQSGVSTRTHATETSGRGVGLDAVLHTVQGLGGQIQVDSQAGLGTTFTIRVPRRLTLESCLIVHTDETWLVPVSRVGRIEADGRTILGVDGQATQVHAVGAIIAVPVQPVPTWLDAPHWLGLAILPDGRPAPVVRLAASTD